MKMFSPNVWQPSVLQEYESRAQINTLDIVYQAGAFQATNTKDEFTSIRHRWQDKKPSTSCVSYKWIHLSAAIL